VETDFYGAIIITIVHDVHYVRYEVRYVILVYSGIQCQTSCSRVAILVA